MSTEMQVTKYSVTDAAINTMRERLKELTDDKIQDLKERLEGLEADTPQGYALVMRGLSETRGLRVEVEKVRKELKADSLLWGRTVDGEAKRITASLEELEAPLKQTRHEADVIKEQAELAKLETERKIREQEEARQRAELEAEHAERMRIAGEKLAAEKAQFAEEKRLADKEAARAREEIEKAKARQAEEKKKAQEALEAEREKIATELRAKKLEMDRLQMEADDKAAAAQAIIDAEAHKIAEAAQKAADDKKVAADSNLRQLFETDTEVLRRYAREVESVVPGHLNSKQAKDLVEEVHKQVVTAVDNLWRVLAVYKVMR